MAMGLRRSGGSVVEANAANAPQGDGSASLRVQASEPKGLKPAVHAKPHSQYFSRRLELASERLPTHSQGFRALRSAPLPMGRWLYFK